MPRSLTPSLLLLALELLVRPLSADPSQFSEPRLHLSWVRTPSALDCPNVQEVEADVTRRLGRSPFAPGSSPPGTIEALVTKEDDRFQASIEMRNASGDVIGSRTVESAAPTCDSVAAAAGLAIALMIEPTLPEPTAPLPPAASPAPAPTPVEKVEAPTPSAPHARGSFTAGLVTAARTLPRLSIGVTTRGEVAIASGVVVGVSMHFLPEQIVEQSGADVGFGMTLGALGPCYRLELDRSWAVSACASLLVGALHVSVKSPEPVAPRQGSWFGASGGLRLDWISGALDVGAELFAFAHFDREEYLVERQTPEAPTSLFVEPGVGALGTITAGVRF